MRLISKASFFCIQALFLSTLLSVRLSHAGQVWEAWAKIYSGPVTNGSDMANAVAIDENGAIYVTGYSLGTDGNNDIATVAYSSNGTALWTNRYDGGTGTTAHAVAIGVRGGGPVYVTGYTGANPFWWVTIAYSAAGAALWTNYYSGPNNSGSPRSLAVGDYGNVYVTGSIYADGSSDDYATVAYSSNKTLLWASRYGGPTNSQDLAEAVAVDNSGRVYVTGSSSSFTSGRAQDYVTVAYSSAGLALWTNVYNGSANSNDLPAAIAAGGGNVYVTGSSRSIAGDYDFATVAYSNSGAPLWTMRYNGPGNGDDRAQAMAADASGNVYVTGYSRGATSSDDYATISYSSAGAVRWVKRYNGPANSVDWARAIALDSRGNVYVSGFSVGLGSDYDFAMIAYANDGTAFCFVSKIYG